MPVPTEIIQARLVARTSDQDLLIKLADKCKEYRGRMADPTDPALQLDAYYKYEILNLLLLQGVINVEDLWTGHESRPGFNREAFTTALQVILVYNSGDLRTINPETGTGLR